MGGEKAVSVSIRHSRTGSPPRGRGKVSCTYTAICSKGITPAWAGKRSSSNVPGQVYWDHPRVGGEKNLPSMVCEMVRGSPPRGRGKAAPTMQAEFFEGITPAWAGKSERERKDAERREDHPRAGGEKDIPIMRAQRIWGSPPHRRGKEAAFSARPPAFPGLPPRRRGKVPLDHRHPLGEGITPA